MEREMQMNRNFSRALLAAAVAGVLSLSSAAFAQYAVPPFSLTVTNTSAAGLEPSFQLITGIPAGIYGSYTVSVDWGGSVGDAWSSEAIWAFTDAPTLTPTPIFYADPGASPDSFDDALPETLTWSGAFDINYDTTAGPLYFLAAQAFAPTSAQWNSITITLDAPLGPPTPPVAVNATVGGSFTSTLGAGEVEWYKFDYAGGDLVIDTEGSTLSDNDTELGLYNSAGALVASDDDGGSGFLSLLVAVGLPADTYYLAVSGWSTIHSNRFEANSTSTITGTVQVNGLSLAPSILKGDFGGNPTPSGIDPSLDGTAFVPDNAISGLDTDAGLLFYSAPDVYALINPAVGSYTLAQTLALADFGGTATPLGIDPSLDGTAYKPDGAISGLDVDAFLLFISAPDVYALIQATPRGPGLTSIPEPMALGLLAPLGLAMARRRR
jgi:hypothetical protein